MTAFSWLATALLALTAASANTLNFSVVYQWNKIDYAWPTDSSKAQALSLGRYQPEHNAPAGLAVLGQRVFVSVPRYLQGVPSTLNWLPSNGASSTSPKLHPFPSWDMQGIGNCSALQNVFGLEVDSHGRLWAVDAGRLFTRKNQRRSDLDKCPPKLLIFDLNNNNSIELRYEFPEDVVSRNSSLLSDLVLDKTSDDWLAYISDASGHIIVFSLGKKKSWRVQHPSMLAAQPEHEPLPLGRDLGVSGLALSPLNDRTFLYFSTLSSPELFSVPVSELRAGSDKLTVKSVGTKSAPSRGMSMDNKGLMYFGLLGKQSVATWDTKFSFREELVFEDKEVLQWPDTFAFDASDNLWLIANKLQALLQRKLNLDETNFRLIKAAVGAKSYMYNDWTSQDSNDATSNSLAIATLLFSVLTTVSSF
ncbi:protein yellow-like isoform X2 [Cloeon dipterum]|uniref:protein yellow-like isoform X2 n=1 Tax=Cloeon dipterum TaxID=197152 RepID=UPI0032205956